ncbi:hypothetical protein BVX94_02365 [bacterium B17]|nr:hypothetical protein BVX94_02365 [bacterium B17]
MKCQVVQTELLGHAQKAEKTLFNCLKHLPANYYLYRELKLSPVYRERVKGLNEVKPDFVVVGPEVGAVSIEVKDWNISRNSYRWVNQYKVEVSEPSGRTYTITNPADQAERYLYALQALLQPADVFVSSLIAFPLISRQDFLNKFADIASLHKAQSRFFMDLNNVIFRDDLDRCGNCPETILSDIVQKHARFSPGNDNVIRSVAAIIMPETFIVGGIRERQSHRQKMAILSEEQQRWAFDLSQENNYLLDVPGSGKTNVLISKAMQLVLQDPANRPKVLITTYNTNLENNIRNIFQDKVSRSQEEKNVFLDQITVMGMPRLIESIIQKADPSVLSKEGSEPDEQYENRLKEWAVAVLDDGDGEFAVFDYIMIDEVQDFDDLHLYVLTQLCRQKQYFFVGDIGQKIYQRSHNLKKHGILAHRLQVPQSFRMYRTPKYIADLAVRFVRKNEIIRNEFEAHGYLDCFQYPNENTEAAVLCHTSHCNEDISACVKDFLSQGYSESEILIIASCDMVSDLLNTLHVSEISAEELVNSDGKKESVIVTDFMNVKGLEREVVVVAGIENLAHRGADSALFSNQEEIAIEESLSRRMIYVALTRSTEHLYLFYTDTANPFVRELLEIDQIILKKRKKDLKNG